ncbi:MAG TPA: sugar phosphate isomerase/epimerase family protein [Planctomycetota bacterium]
MYLAYNTNGLAHHRLDEALRMLADLGYGGVAITPDVPHLDLLRTGEADWEKTRALLDRLKLRRVVETGARYVLDARRKHWPNLCTPDDAAAERRLDWYRRACRLSNALGAEGVSIWSGPLEPGDAPDAAFPRLVKRLHRALDDAEGARICFEPEPGMLIDSLSRYRQLRAKLGRQDLWTTIDTGHLVVTEPGEPQSHLAEFAGSLINVQVDDARRGVHEHLAPGQGIVDFAAIFRELKRLNYKGPLALELSRDSHRAADAAAEAYAKLAPLL